jgi:hypothetical protein
MCHGPFLACVVFCLYFIIDIANRTRWCLIGVLIFISQIINDAFLLAL